MARLTESEIVQFLKDNIEPLHDDWLGNGYRAAATLRDGTHLPCVIFRGAPAVLKYAGSRLEEERKKKRLFQKDYPPAYYDTLKRLVTKGNSVAPYDIDSIQKSRCAFPNNILRQIKGETAIGWTAFVAGFKDGRRLSFGTRWYRDFFNLPDGFDPVEITEIIMHSYLSKTGEIVRHGGHLNKLGQIIDLQEIHFDKPFFECCLDTL